MNSSETIHFPAPVSRTRALRLLFAVGAFGLIGAINGCSLFRSSGECSVTIRVLPDSIPSAATMFLSGNRYRLGDWRPDGAKMHKAVDGAWVYAFEVDSGTHIEFKFTRGSWASEAVDEEGQEMPNFTADIVRDTVLTYRIHRWRDLVSVVPVVSQARMDRKAGQIELFDQWKFMAGDSAGWSNPEFDDSRWPTLSPALAPGSGTPPGWKGVGWFRLTLKVDSSLWEKPIALIVGEAGASEFYLSGNLLFKFGTAPSDSTREKPYEDSHPRPFVFDRRVRQVLAVRYFNSHLEEFYRASSDAGFSARIVDAIPSTVQEVDQSRIVATYQTMFLTVAVILTLLHLLLFFFDRSQKAALVLALLTGGVAYMSYLDYLVRFVSVSRLESLHLSRLSILPAPFLGILGLLAAFFISNIRPPKRFYAYVSLAAVTLAWGFAAPGEIWMFVLYGIIALSSLEWLWIVGKAVFDRSEDRPGELERPIIIAIGATFFVAGVICQLLINLGEVFPILPIPPYYIGFLAFALSLTIHLSYTSAIHTREVRRQLIKVQELSAKALEHERTAREEEIRLRLIEADNERKTKELEEARTFQLSMLPREVPMPPTFDIALRMKTATEVGGDYYDVRCGEDGSILVAIGDVTGHGMRAGIMVAAMKTLFNSSAVESDLPSFFHRCTRVLRQMQVRNLYMGLTLLRIEGYTVRASIAGMPPILIYRAAERRVEEIMLKAMPLGAHEGFPYEERSFSLTPGDAILLTTDGFTELFNERDEMFGLLRVSECFGTHALRPTEEIVDSLISCADSWRGAREQLDDLTLVVLKAKHPPG